MSSYDVAIVGNGAIGLSLGLMLAKRRARVVVIGEPHRPWCASAAAGAMLGCFGEVTAAGMQSPHGKARLEMAIRARSLWPDWLAELSDAGSDPQTASGTVLLLNAASIAQIDDANFSTIMATLQERGEPYEEVDPAQIDWLVSAPDMRPLRALYLPGEHAVDAARLLDSLQAEFLRTGGIVKPGLAMQIERHGDRIASLKLSSGEQLATSHVVIAAGVGSQRLLDQLPDFTVSIPPIICGFGTSLVLRGPSPGPAHVVRTPNRAFGCGLHAVPRGTEFVYIGATNIVQPEAGETAIVQDVASLMNAAARQLRRDLWFADIVRIQTGNRPISADGFPLLGPTGLDGLWLATATNRDGLHLSPFLAGQFADWILDGRHDPILDAFAPTRRPIETMTRLETIESAARQTVASGQESGWNVPHEWTRLMDQQMVGVFQRVADEISQKFVPPPEILSGARSSPAMADTLRRYYAAAASR